MNTHLIIINSTESPKTIILQHFNDQAWASHYLMYIPMLTITETSQADIFTKYV